MKISKEHLRKLIRESLSEITDLEAVGAEEAYGDDNEEEAMHVRGMLSQEREVNINRIEMMKSDLATLSSIFKQQNGDPQVLNLIENCISNLEQIQNMI